MSDKGTNKNKDIFIEAAKSAAEQAIKAGSKLMELDGQEKLANDIVEEEGEGWSVIKGKINKEWAERFSDVMGELSDREFVRNYLKILEYVKPKIVRKEEISDDPEDQLIQIQILQINENGEQKVLEIGKNGKNIQE